MTEIDRRALITVAGAGLLVAACKEDQPKAGAAAPTPTPGTTDQSGTGEPYGQLVSSTGPTTAGDTKAFSPSKICVVLLRFEAAGKLIARRSYIAYPPAPVTKKALAGVIEPELVLLRAGTSSSDYKQDIEPINLKEQRLLVIYIDHPDDEVHFKIGNAAGAAKYDRTLLFMKYSGKDPAAAIRENHAFFNADEIPLPTLNSRALSLQYWDTDENGDRLRDPVHKPYLYSLNIQLEVASPSVDASGAAITRWIPVIVDPDTGNMGVEP